MNTVVACDFDFHETKHVSHYTYAIAKVVLNTSVQIVITLYSDADSRWVKNIVFVLQGEDYAKWTDDRYITEVVERKVAEFMPRPPTPPPVVVEEEVLPPIAEEVVEEVKELPREEVVEKKVVAKKRCSKKATPIIAEKTPVAVW